MEVECPNCGGHGTLLDLNCRRCQGMGWLPPAALAVTRDDFHVGFTGTQEGMTVEQVDVVRRMMRRLAERHGDRLRAFHGDCVGADFQFDDVCRLLGVWRGIYPSNIKAKRAHCEARGAVEMAPEAPPLERNTRIVVASRDLLIAGPKGPEEMRSGTWSTVRRGRKRYAETKRGAIAIAWPSGVGEMTHPERRQLVLV